MKQFFLLTLALLSFASLNAQTKLYKGNSTMYSDCLYTINGAKVYNGNSTMYSDCVFTIDGNKVYKGNSTMYSDCLGTLKGDLPITTVAILLGNY